MQRLSERVWVVRSGRNSVHVEHFRSAGVVAIGWGEVGEIEPALSDLEIRRVFDEAFPSEKPKTRVAWAGQVKRFLREIEKGDSVVTYDRGTRLYHIGEVLSDGQLRSRVYADQELREFFRRVEWKNQCSRDTLSANTRNSLGSALTLFLAPKETAAELQQKISDEGSVGPINDDVLDSSDESDDEQFLLSYIASAGEFVEDKIASLDWRQLQNLVAGIMRGMGYRTRVSGQGADRGVDVFASPDGLGLDEPRIFIEVKHREGTVGAPLIRTFLGGRQLGDRCLYVSTGGFTNEARYEADRSSIPLRLVTMSDLRELLVEFYEKLDSETRDLVPLKKVFLPV